MWFQVGMLWDAKANQSLHGSAAAATNVNHFVRGPSNFERLRLLAPTTAQKSVYTSSDVSIEHTEFTKPHYS
jgi:hypothetical protein